MVELLDYNRMKLHEQWAKNMQSESDRFKVTFTLVLHWSYFQWKFNP